MVETERDGAATRKTEISPITGHCLILEQSDAHCALAADVADRRAEQRAAVSRAAWRERSISRGSFCAGMAPCVFGR